MELKPCFMCGEKMALFFDTKGRELVAVCQRKTGAKCGLFVETGTTNKEAAVAEYNAVAVA